MVKCPNCGHETQVCTADAGIRYRKAVEQRLTEYGYPEGMNPEKHQAATAIKKVIRIRTGVKVRAGGWMPEDEANRCLAELDRILPGKEAGVCEDVTPGIPKIIYDAAIEDMEDIVSGKSYCKRCAYYDKCDMGNTTSCGNFEWQERYKG